MKKQIIKIYTLFMAFSLLFLLNAKGQESSTKLIKVVAEMANIRLKPDIGSIIIQQVPKGTILESVKKEGEWHLINIKTEEGDIASGYVHESLVLVIEPPRKTKEKAEEKPPSQPVPVTPPSIQPPEHQFDLFLIGGGNLILGGDLNRGSKGLADFYSDSLGIQKEGKVKPARLSYIFGGELTFPLFSKFYIGVGADYFLGEKKSRVTFPNGSSTDTFTTRPKIQAVPLRLVISFYPFSFVYVKSGVEYYFAKCAYFYRFEREEFWQEWHGEASAQGFGFLGGLGFEWSLSSSLSFIIEATGRYAKIAGFKGESKYKEITGELSKEEGMLYFYNAKNAGEKSYPLLFIREKKPTEAGVSDVHEATIDFSGMSLKTGFKIKF